MPHHEDVEFKTLDGIILRGWLYPASQRGSAVILTPGFACVKEMFIPEVAEQFQQAGITALIYDPRSTGTSDGQPRNEIDPTKQIEDYSDALSFLKTQAIVDPNRIGLWGMSFSATIALCAAALDKRAKFVIAICPLTAFERGGGEGGQRFASILAKAMKDREFQVKGNGPLYLPLLSAQGDNNPAGAMGIWDDRETLEYLSTAQARVAPAFESRITIQTYYRLLLWQPSGLVRYVTPTPALIVVPELDQVSPPADQIALFGLLSPPKRLHLAPGKGHLNVLSGDDFPVLMELQVAWLRAELEAAARGVRE